MIASVSLAPVLAPVPDPDRSPASPWVALDLPPTPLFGTDGIRGRVGMVGSPEHLLTPSLALQVGFWAGQVLRTQTQNEIQDWGPIVLGQDSRTSSDLLALSLAAGLTTAGLEVWNLGLCPTPAVAYLTHTTAALGGIMISASHNPPEDNGIKIFGATGSKLSLELQQAIEQGIRGQRSFPFAPGSNGFSQHPSQNLSQGSHPWGCHYPKPHRLADYTIALKQSLDRASLSGLKVVLDLAWGAAVHLAPQVFAELGATVIPLHDRPDGQRINVNCGSTHLRHLQQAVVDWGADLGFAFDGDADRVLAVDHQGRAVNGDYILYLWGQHLKQQGRLPGNTIVTTVMANLGFERAWQQQGGTLVRTAVGDQYVQAEMANRGAMLGGEQSGHILCRHYGVTGDGLLSALHLAELVQTAGVPLAELMDQSFHPYPQLLRNVRVEDRHQRLHWQDCADLQQAIARAEADLGDRGRILVRASGTEPVIRVMVEAAAAPLVEHWTEFLVAAVEQHLAS